MQKESFWHDGYELYLQNPPANARDVGSVLGLGRSPIGENGNSFQYSFLENSTDRGAWWATAHGVAESDMTEHTMHIEFYTFNKLFYINNSKLLCKRIFVQG